MNKVWFLMLALIILTGPAYGTLVDVAVSGHDDNDSSGTITPGDVVHIKIVSRVLIMGIDFGLQVTGPGTLAEKGSDLVDRMAHHADFVLWAQSEPNLIENNAISNFAGAAFVDIAPPSPGETVDLVWNLKIICGEPDDINIDLQLAGPSLYKNDAGDPEYLNLAEADLGDLAIQVQQAPPGKELIVNVVGGNGTVEPSQGTYPSGTAVALTAIPDPGYRVKYWSGADNKRSLLSTNAVTMNKNKTVKVKFEPIPDDGIRKAQFKAGKTRELQNDSFLILGTLSAGQQDILDANEVFISVGTAAEPHLFNDTFTINDDGFKYLGHQAGLHFAGEPGRLKRLNINVKSGKFLLMATGLDLAGLSTPVRLELRFGGYQYVFTIDEDIINGPKKFIPMKYLLGVADALRVEKKSVRTNQTTSLVSVTVQGSIALENPDVDISSAGGGSITLSWEGFTETIAAPDGMINQSHAGAKFTYKRPKAAAATHFVTKAVFDLQKCTFQVTIKNAALTDTGAVSFGVLFDDGAEIVFDEEVIIDLDS